MSEILEMLHPAVRELWLERFNKLTPPQEKAIPLILNGKNVLIVSPTGTGKTEAAFLPILSQMLEDSRREEGIKLLYITPLRTLNRDILRRLEYWSLKLDLRLGIRHGDTSQAERRKQTLAPPDIMVTTPESMQLLLTGRKLKHHLETVRWVVIDEVHELADSKRGTQLSILMERLKGIVEKIQIVGLSATIGNPYEIAKLLVGDQGSCEIVYTPIAKEIDAKAIWPDPSRRLAEKLFLTPEMAGRLKEIIDSVNSNRTTLIFTNTRPAVEFLGSRLMLWDENFPVYVHHGSLSQTKRVSIESMLKEGKLRGVVCTSSMELGIDIGYIDFVIQFNSPREAKRLIQRVGRSGHALGRASRGLIIVGNSDDALESLVLIERMKKNKIEPSEIPDKPYDVLAHEIMGLIISGNWNEESIYQLVSKAYPYRNLGFDELLNVLRFMEEIELSRRSWDRLIPTQRGYRYFYAALSTIPEVMQYKVVERSSREFIGFLDDRFVAEYCEIGARFIMGGAPWEIISLGEDTVYVERVEYYGSAIPSWVGEEIPVPFEVALEVGRIRGKVEEMALSGLKREEISKILAREHETEYKTMKRAIRSVYEMVRRNMPVPTDRRIVAEQAGNLVIVHAHFGNRINRALARFLGYRITRMTGLSAYLSEGPYRIVLRTEARAGDVANLLVTSREEFLRDLKSAVEESKAFRWRLEQVARKMGVLEKETRLTKSLADKLLVGLRGTPVHEEALKEAMNRDLDIRNALMVVESIQRGDIEVKICDGPSPLSMEHVRDLRSFMEPINPEKRQIISFLSFKMRIMNEFVTFGCLDCSYVFNLPVRGIDELACPVCGSSSLSFDMISKEEMSSRLKRCSAGKGGRGCQNLKTGASLLEKYGINAVIARASGMSFREVKAFLDKWEGGDIFRKLYYHLRQQNSRLRRY